MTARRPDLFQGGIADAHTRPAVDQQQLPLQRWQARGLFGQDGVEKRANAESLGPLAPQRYFPDASFDHLDLNASTLNILRRNDSPTQMETRGPIEVADRGGDGGEVGLRDPFSEIGVIGS